MKNSFTDIIVVGAGYAGLSASYYLKQHGLDHIVLERGKVGESWRSQRWDSFRLNTPDRLRLFPGEKFTGNDPERFCTTNEFISSFEQCVSSSHLPVIENTTVTSIEKNDELFTVTVKQDNKEREYQCRQVIIASGCANERLVPLFSVNISPRIKQFHTGGYRNPSQVPDGAVLVVGGAQSGIQIAEDLADAGRKVYLSTSMVARVPRNYRGRDIHDWLIDMKFFNVTKEQITDPAMLKMKPPQITGVGSKPRTISLQSIAKKGVTILGKMENADEKNAFFQPNAAAHVKFADGFSAKVKAMIEEYVAKSQMTALTAETDPDDLPDINAACASDINSLNFEASNIGSVIWATGFGGNYNYIKLPVFESDGNPKHFQGTTDVEGLYFLGVPWLRNRKSVILFGIKEDAEFIADKVFNYARDKKSVQVAES